MGWLKFLKIILLAELVSASTRSKLGQLPDQLPGKSEDSPITCKGEGGQQLDWFIIYKLAQNRSSSNNLIRQGFGHAFISPEQKLWKMSHLSIGDKRSMAGLTTEMIYSALEDKFLYLAYNDQPPDVPYFPGGGHMKGIIIANKDGGIWLQQTVPKFPNMTRNYYSYPNNGRSFGQTFFCMTLSRPEIDSSVGDALKISQPHVYSFHFPKTISQFYPNLANLLPTKYNLRRNSYNKTSVFHFSAGDLNITVFPKAPHNKIDVYSDWIAPSLKSNLRVQTWQKGVNMLECVDSKGYFVTNIESKSINGVELPNKFDHSKWAVGDAQWTCLGDLNRKESQKVRGGTTLCTREASVWENFDRAILGLYPCDLE